MTHMRFGLFSMALNASLLGLSGCKTATEAKVTAVESAAALEPFFPRDFTAEELKSINPALFFRYCTFSCHAGHAARGFVSGDDPTKRQALAHAAPLLTHMIDWEHNSGLTMPKKDSTERFLIEEKDKDGITDRQRMLAALKPFVDAAGPQAVKEVEAGVRRGVMIFTSEGQKTIEAALAACPNTQKFEALNQNDNCRGISKTLFHEENCTQKSCFRFPSGNWTCGGKMAWICVPEPKDD